ncbi:MAG: hypothetical protein JWO73_639 [Candidatus Taylorbacteria bacterium]|nr:hypothetical protein [Candidatus Taylorbacteria bacterium]
MTTLNHKFIIAADNDDPSLDVMAALASIAGQKKLRSHEVLPPVPELKSLFDSGQSMVIFDTGILVAHVSLHPDADGWKKVENTWIAGSHDGHVFKDRILGVLRTKFPGEKITAIFN